MTYETIVVEKAEDGVMTVTLNRPEVLNAFNDRMQAEFSQLWGEVKDDDDVRAVVIAAAGDRAFCTGVDVTERLDSDSPFLDRAHPWAENEDPGRLLSPGETRCGSRSSPPSRACVPAERSTGWPTATSWCARPRRRSSIPM